MSHLHPMNAESLHFSQVRTNQVSGLSVATDEAKGEPPPSAASDPVIGEPRGRHQNGSTRRIGKYSTRIGQSRRRSGSAESYTSDDSMSPKHGDSITPPESPANKVSPGGSPPHIGRLYLEKTESIDPKPPRVQSRGQLSASLRPTSEQPASSELPSPSGKVSPSSRISRASHAAGALLPGRTGPWVNRQGHQDRLRQPNITSRDDLHAPFRIPGYDQRKSVALGGHNCEPMPRDSGCDNMPSWSNTVEYKKPPLPDAQPARKGSSSSKYPRIIPQLISCPISQEQLAAEVKGIYAGLVIVEAKCINIDAAQAADTQTVLNTEQWRALIALHRTLLYEHHDFLMATHHPSATESLKRLGERYNMPARMWKHGIHAFLEVLRHRRPGSQEHMLSFIYLAYDMMTLLYETVPYFRDTWIECLGDLARYRMAIEEDREPHAQWASVAASWYTKAADRLPHIGRLYHHLGILERPSLRKFACYGTSLTCVMPFPNAKDSMKTLCDPIVEEEKPVRAPIHATEASLCRLHALMFFGSSEDAIQKAFATVSSFMSQPANFRWKDCGVPLAVINISALLGYGSPSNKLRAAYDCALQRKINSMRSSGQILKIPNFSANAPRLSQPDQETATRILKAAKESTVLAFHAALRSSDSTSIPAVLPFLHVMLGFVHSLSSVTRSMDSNHISDLPLHLRDFSWGQLADFLNALVDIEPITARIEQCARTGVWIQPEEFGDSKKALPEDFFIRGLVWAQEMFCPGWFGDKEDEYGRTIETSSTTKSRAERAEYWGLRLAFETNYISYDARSHRFCSPNIAETKQANMGSASVGSTVALLGSAPPSSQAQSTSPSSCRTSSDCDFVHVRKPETKAVQALKPKPTAQSRTWAAVASGGKNDYERQKKQKVDGAEEGLKIVEADVMEWEVPR